MLKPYPKYKNSGIEWMGQVPDKWAIKPVKRLFRIVNGATPTSTVPEYWDGNIPWVTPDDLGSNSSVIINDTRRQITEQGYNSCGTTLIPEGSLVMSTRAPIGYLAIAGKPMCSNQGCKSLVALSNTRIKYYYYFLSASKDYIAIFGKGSTFKELSRDDLANIPALEPAKDDANRIIKILDDRTAQVDDLIAKKERMIELLKEQRAAVINEAVTKGLPAEARAKAGLDPNVKMKPVRRSLGEGGDSGVEWIGEVPEHWRVKKLKYLCKKIGSGITPTGGASVYLTEGIPILRSQNIYFDGLRLDDVAYISNEIHQAMKNTKVLFGDVLLNITGASIGRCNLWLNKGEANVSQHVSILRPNDLIESKYLYYFMSSEPGQHQIDKTQSGISREGLNFEDLKKFIIPLPSKNEQNEIIKYLNIEMNQYDNAINKATRGIEFLKEYRASMISEVVTGKINVS